MPHLGRPYDLVPGESLITILAYRGGALAKAGHNHVVAPHDLSGTIYVPEDLMRASVQVRIPVDGLTVDEASLRAREGPDFSADVPDSAKEGTRHNMLSEALLSAAGNPEILLESQSLEVGGATGSRGASTADEPSPPSGNLTAHIRVTIRKAPHSIAVPLHYEMRAPDRVTVSGEVPIKQSDLGLMPFSALLGALQVQDEIRVKFQLSAKAAGGR
jgi:polyisoprenoid-binding protein YceI